MKLGMCIILSVLLLCACGAQPTFETVGNVWDNPQTEELPASIEFGLPEDAQMEVIESSGTSKSYQIGQWMLWTEIHSGGDVLETMQYLTGMDEPEIISHPSGAYECHEAVWSVAEEEGEAVIRTAVIPKGQYHYCLSMKAPSEDAQQMGRLFSQIVKSVYLNDIGP